MKRKALWSSLVGRYGVTGLEINVRFTSIQWLIWALVLLIIFFITLLIKVIEENTIVPAAYVLVLIPSFFIITAVYYGRYPTGTKFIIVYEDKIIISTHSDADGPGFVTVSRKEYWVDVIARDMEVRDPEKHKIYTLVFNKPIRGCMHVRLLPDMYISEEELMKLIKILEPRRVLLNGYYFPCTYAIFKMVCGEKYSDLAERLLKDFKNEVEKYGFHKVCAIMNALKSLCLAGRIDNAVCLARAIVNGKAFEYVNLINENSYLKWFYDETFFEPPSYAYNFFYKLFKFCVVGPILIPIIPLFISMILSIADLKMLCEEFFLFSIVCTPLIAYGFGLGAFTAHPTYWSRVSIKCGMKCEIVYMVLAALIPWILSLAPFFLLLRLTVYFWVFAILSILFLPPSIIMMLVMCGYPQYKVGLKHAEILLNALRK